MVLAVLWIRARTVVGIVGGVLQLVIAIVVGFLDYMFWVLERAGGLLIQM